MLTRIGVGAWIMAATIVVFKGITKLMEKDMFWTDFTLSTLFGDFTERIIDAFPAGWFQRNVDILMYDIEIYILLIGLGIVLFIIGAFKKV
ncbi:MAG: hypothetical protein D3926_20145 [Desulfobacteraceae bacterium]|nr:MAG: hypothetical protein D3926_20145 [Desulfobacteraceae bacterium]